MEHLQDLAAWRVGDVGEVQDVGLGHGLRPGPERVGEALLREPMLRRIPDVILTNCSSQISSAGRPFSDLKL